MAEQSVVRHGSWCSGSKSRAAVCEMRYPKSLFKQVNRGAPSPHQTYLLLTLVCNAGDVTTILLADDDRRIRESLERALSLEGYEVLTAPNGAEALRLHAKGRPDLLLLDVSMPDVDGLSVCRAVRAANDDTPILMLTARHEITDRVRGLDAGADDYLVKPFALEELLARLRARLRTAPTDAEGWLTFCDLAMDLSGRRAFSDGVSLDLSRTEFDLLGVLLRNAGVVLSREHLYELVWGGELDSDSKTLDVYVGYLRKKLQARGGARVLHTVRGVGYVLRTDVR